LCGLNDIWLFTLSLLKNLQVGCIDRKYKKAQLTPGLRATAPSFKDGAVPRWPSAAILDIIEPEIAPFDPPTPKTLA